MKLSDFHIHTSISACARPTATVQGYIDVSAEEGLTSIGFSDHLWDTDISPSKIYQKNTFEDLQKIFPLIPEDTKGVNVFVGCETDINVYGQIGITKEHASLLDYVLIPISHYHNPENRFLGIDVNDKKFMRKFAIDRFIKACDADLPVPTGICHPFVPYGTLLRDELLQEITDNDFLMCFKYAAEKNVFIELHWTTDHQRWTNVEDGFSVEYMRMATLAKEAGCKFSLGSDAHEHGSFASGVHSRELSFAKRCGITEDLIISEFPKNNKNF